MKKLEMIFWGICAVLGICAGTISAEEFKFEEKDNSVRLLDGGEPVWDYAVDLATHENIPSDDPRRMAGCYFHPVWGVNGEILTDNAPEDHYHHHGVFWTWPHVLLHNSDGTVEEYDLWTSNTAIRQRAIRIIRQENVGESAVMEVENGWFIGDSAKSDSPSKADCVMTERVTITTGPVHVENGVKSRAIDLAFVWTPVDRAISLRGAEEKSYGGLTVRFQPKNKPLEADFITTSAGVAAEDMPEKPLAWADYTSRFGNGESFSGMAIFVPTDHPDFPPTWLTRYYGALCVGWPGVIGKEFPAGKEIRLNYRLWIHDGKLSTDRIAQEYDAWIK